MTGRKKGTGKMVCECGHAKSDHRPDRTIDFKGQFRM